MVRMIARAVETGYDSDMPMRADVDPEMHKVGQQTPVPPDGLAPGPSPSSFHPPAAPIIALPAPPLPCARSRWLQGARFLLQHTRFALARMRDACGVSFPQDAKAQRTTGYRDRLLLPLHYSSWGCGGPFSKWGFDDSYSVLVRDVSFVF